MVFGSISVWADKTMIKSLSGDTDMPEDYARKLSLDPAAKGYVVQWGPSSDGGEYVHYREGTRVNSDGSFWRAPRA